MTFDLAIIRSLSYFEALGTRTTGDQGTNHKDHFRRKKYRDHKRIQIQTQGPSVRFYVFCWVTFDNKLLPNNEVLVRKILTQLSSANKTNTCKIITPIVSFENATNLCKQNRKLTAVLQILQMQNVNQFYVNRQAEQEMETVVKVLQPGPLGIIEHKFSAEEIEKANAAVKRAVENWKRNAIIERNRPILKDYLS
ncbi:uncharacterized protein [Rutidosis leptorrhynchoides]|uniref:uncharacterized protein n=1 Tax=Rutidosis leptorrhynchoides TaxID=125765 RepID=UPI003A99D35E